MKSENLLRRALGWVVVCLAFVACNSRPDYVIEEDAMVDLLVDVHLSEGLLDVQGLQMRDHKNYGQEVMAAVLVDHGVTRAQYDTSLVWYSQHLKYLIRIYKRVDEQLDERIEHWRTLADEVHSLLLCEEGDSIDVWGGDRALILDAGRLSQSRCWRLPVDSCFWAGDTLRLRLHSYDMPKGQALLAALSLMQENTVVKGDVFMCGSSSSAINQDSTVILTCAADPEKTLTNVVVSLHLLHTQQSDTVALAPALVDSLQLIRIHRH